MVYDSTLTFPKAMKDFEDIVSKTSRYIRLNHTFANQCDVQVKQKFGGT